MIDVDAVSVAAEPGRCVPATVKRSVPRTGQDTSSGRTEKSATGRQDPTPLPERLNEVEGEANHRTAWPYTEANARAGTRQKNKTIFRKVSTEWRTTPTAGGRGHAHRARGDTRTNGDSHNGGAYATRRATTTQAVPHQATLHAQTARSRTQQQTVRNGAPTEQHPAPETPGSTRFRDGTKEARKAPRAHRDEHHHEPIECTDPRKPGYRPVLTERGAPANPASTAASRHLHPRRRGAFTQRSARGPSERGPRRGPAARSSQVMVSIQPLPAVRRQGPARWWCAACALGRHPGGRLVAEERPGPEHLDVAPRAPSRDRREHYVAVAQVHLPSGPGTRRRCRRRAPAP